MRKKNAQKTKANETIEKEVDLFVERLLDILIIQAELSTKK